MKKAISCKEYILFAEAWILLALSRIILLLFPFKKIVPILGKQVSLQETEQNIIQSDLQRVQLHQLAIAIARGCHYSFWRTLCFEQAITAKLMLRRRGFQSIIYFGVYKNPVTQNIEAHAWVNVNGFMITGGRNLNLYSVISSFKG